MPEIRKIVVGPDFKDGMTFSVGQRVARERDENNEGYGKFKEKIDKIILDDLRYEIWLITIDGSKEIKLWRYFENMPISVELNINY